MVLIRVYYFVCSYWWWYSGLNSLNDSTYNNYKSLLQYSNSKPNQPTSLSESVVCPNDSVSCCAATSAWSRYWGNIWKWNDNWSIGLSYLRAWFCKVPVRKPCGKKKPESQKDLGAPCSIQCCENKRGTNIMTWKNMKLKVVDLIETQSFPVYMNGYF